MMEDLPAYAQVVAANGAIRLEKYAIAPQGVHATATSSGKRYQVVIGILGVTCTCPTASQFYRFDLLFVHEAIQRGRALGRRGLLLRRARPRAVASGDGTVDHRG